MLFALILAEITPSGDWRDAMMVFWSGLGGLVASVLFFLREMANMRDKAAREVREAKEKDARDARQALIDDRQAAMDFELKKIQLSQQTLGNAVAKGTTDILRTATAASAEARQAKEAAKVVADASEERTKLVVGMASETKAQTEVLAAQTEALSDIKKATNGAMDQKHAEVKEMLSGIMRVQADIKARLAAVEGKN